MTSCATRRCVSSLDLEEGRTSIPSIGGRFAGIEQWSRFIQDDHYAFHAELAGA